MSVKTDLDLMKRNWEDLGIDGHFKKIHHGSLNEYRMHPSSLEKFYLYCDQTNIQEQNQRTIKRALETAELVKQGQDIESAIKSAWEEYPPLPHK